MNHEDYVTRKTQLLREAERIETEKRPGYVIGREDVLANFKTVAERTGCTVGQVWAAYFLKHIDAITAITCKPDLPVSEAPLGRFADAVNYLKLGWALLADHSEPPVDTAEDETAAALRASLYEGRAA